MKTKTLYISFLFFLIGLNACSKKDLPLPKKHVDVAIVHSDDIPYIFDYPGTVSGVADFPVMARVSGVLFKQLYKEGSRVKKGQQLYQIDPRPFENQLVSD